MFRESFDKMLVIIKTYVNEGFKVLLLSYILFMYY